jgi:cobalt-zinc-cadmium efflux system outer membrane protein
MSYVIRRSRSFLLVALVALAALAAPRAHADAPAPTSLADSARWETIAALVQQRNPDLAAARGRIEAAAEQAQVAAGLPDPELKYEQWGVPLRRPWQLGDANALMVGVSQTLPAWGARAARARMAAQDDAGAQAAWRLRRRDLRAEARHAFADYFRADRELQLHREHVELTAKLVELARASYRAGRSAQQDVLRLTLELSRLHRDLAHIEQDRVSAQALLNTLMDRPIDAALGPPPELMPAPAHDDSRDVDPARPEIVQARAAVAKSAAADAAARSEARWPSVTLGIDYMYMPFMADRHGWGAKVMLNLPWLNGARAHATAASTAALTADQHALAAVQNSARYQARESRARYDAARATFEIIEQDLLPQARRNFETAQAAYGTGQGDAIALVDALRSYLDIRLDRVRSLVHLDDADTELRRASGTREETP